MYIVIHKSGKKKKNEYVLLLEAYRQEDGSKRSRIVKNFGRLDALLKDDPEALDKLKAQYSTQREAKKKATAEARLESVRQVLAISNTPDFSDSPVPLLHIGHYPLSRIWDDDLGLTQKIDYLQKVSGSRAKFKFSTVARHMACLKILDPSSVLFSYGHKDDFLGDPLRDISLDNCYDTLGFLKEHKDKIFRWINKKLDHLVGANRATMVFYDVTNTYFEAPLTDAERDYEQVDFGERIQRAAERMRLEKRIHQSDCFDSDGLVIPEKLPDFFWEEDANDRLQYLKMRGPSKEHRTDLPLVSVALVIDQHGLPMDFEVYSGNSSEFKTMKPSIKKLKEKYNIENAVVVADRGLNSAKNLKMLQDLDLGFLVAQKVTNFDAKLTGQMLDLSRYSSFDPENPQSGKYQIISDWKKTGAKGVSVNCMLLLTYNEKRKQRDEKIIDAMIEIVKKKAASNVKIGPCKSGWAALAKTEGDTDCLVLGVDEEVVEKKRRFCGFAAMVYDDSPSVSAKLNKEEDKNSNELKEKVRTLSGLDVAMQYPRLNQIEDCFRVMKSHLGLRPMYVWNSDHVRGHVTVCILALLMLRLLQRRLNQNNTTLGISEICSSLGGACVATLKINNQITFIHTGHQANIRKGRESLSTEKLLTMIQDGEIQTSNIPAIMKACELKPLQKICSLQELGICLRKRFSSPSDAIPALRLATF